MDSKERKGKAGKGKGKAKKEVNKVKVDPLDQLPFELVSEASSIFADSKASQADSPHLSLRSSLNSVRKISSTSLVRTNNIA